MKKYGIKQKRNVQINLNLSKLSSDVRLNVDLFRGSRKQGFENDPETHYAVWKVEKITI